MRNTGKNKTAKAIARLWNLCAPIDVFLKEHLFADVFASDVLSFQLRELVTISALAAMGGLTA